MNRAITARYEPPTFPPAVVLSTTIAFVILTLNRGLGYLTSQPKAVSQFRAGDRFGYHFFGVLLVAAAVAFLVAVAVRRHLLVWAGHALLICVYFGLTITTLGDCLQLHGGWAALSPPIGAVIWHSILSWRMRPLPPPPGH